MMLGWEDRCISVAFRSVLGDALLFIKCLFMGVGKGVMTRSTRS